MERQAKGQESPSPVQDELRGAKAHDDRHSPCSNLRSHSAGSIQRTRFWERPKHVPSPQSHGSSESSEYHRSLLGLSRLASGSQCGEIVMLTRDAESADFGGKRPPCWLEIPVVGIRLRDLSPPPFARCWKPDGSRAHQVFGSHRMAAPLWKAPCLTRRRSSTVSPVTWRCKDGKQRPGILPVPVWREVSSQISPRKPGLS